MPPDNKIEIKISYDQVNKNIQVDGHILDRFVAHVLLDMAREEIDNFHKRRMAEAANASKV